jgi:hypothetical protein
VAAAQFVNLPWSDDPSTESPTPGSTALLSRPPRPPIAWINTLALMAAIERYYY